MSCWKTTEKNQNKFVILMKSSEWLIKMAVCEQVCFCPNYNRVQPIMASRDFRIPNQFGFTPWFTFLISEPCKTHKHSILTIYTRVFSWISRFVHHCVQSSSAPFNWNTKVSSFRQNHFRFPQLLAARRSYLRPPVDGLLSSFIARPPLLSISVRTL